MRMLLLVGCKVGDVPDGDCPHPTPTQAGNDKWLGGIVVGKVAYCVPYSNNSILKLNTINGDLLTLIDSTRGHSP